MSLIQIIFDKVSKIYYSGEYVSGIIRLKGEEGKDHGPIMGRITGGIKFGRKKKDPTSKDTGYRFMSTLDTSVKIADAGKLKDGSNDFEFKLAIPTGEKVVESYKGVHISTNYYLEVTVDSSKNSALFYIQTPGMGYGKKWGTEPRPSEFVIDVEKSEKTPKLLLIGKLDNVNVAVDDPVTGYIILKEVGAEISSIETQLVRVEKYEFEGKSVTDTTEIQNLQIADGNVPLGLELPIYVVLPRYFSAASFDLPQIALDFNLNVIVMFTSGVQAAQSIEMRLHRKQRAK